ncbi:helix-turn-helix domain-containing protein [Paracoccus cavernae]
MNLEKIRSERGLTQGDLADMSGLKQSTISKIERGYDGVTLRSLYKIADALEVDLSELFADSRGPAEAALIQAFRSLPAERQQGWLEMAQAIARPNPEASA